MNSQEHRNLQEAYLGVYEEVDERRSPKELVDRLNASREGHMAQDGPNKPAYDAKQRLLKKAQKRKNMEEQTDLYNIILSHLLDEGYADTNESAIVIMANMSEGWKDNILEAKVDDDLSPQEKEKARNERSGNSTFTRRNLTKVRRGKSPKGLKPVETTPAMTSVRKYEMALKQPNTPVGKRVAANNAMNDAERGPSGRRGS